jgi:16S rRNA (guanine966-N2)-methyltransferase
MYRNRVRIIGGEWRRRWLRFPAARELRPTPSRVRETLFNWLGQDLTGLSCLDLFAGSGALGFEAASRGARQVVMLERDRHIAEFLQASAHILQAATTAGGTVEVLRADALEFLTHDTRAFDVVFIDPPYAFWEQTPRALSTLLSKLARRVASGASAYLESPEFPELPPHWRSLRRGRAGAVHYQLLALEANVQ